MSHSREKNSKQVRSPLPLILSGAGLISIAIAVLIFIPRDNASTNPGTQAGPIPGEVNFMAPALDLTDLSGEPVSLAETRGQVVLVNNWATWCPPCRAEMPELEAYFRAHEGDGFILIGINSGDTQDQVAEFVRQYDLTFPVWLDPTGLALFEFKNNALPSSYVIDKSGTVRLVWMGAVSLEALEWYVTPLLTD